MTHTYKDASQFKKYTPEHDAIMTAYNEPILGAYDFQGKYPFSVKVPEALTFVKFESGYDQDDFIHNRKAHRIAEAANLEFEHLLDYPRYSKNSCQCALRFFFKNESEANKFIYHLTRLAKTDYFINTNESAVA
jgi:hypothetical protein